jgi:hypothetical protein
LWSIDPAWLFGRAEKTNESQRMPHWVGSWAL